MSAKTYQVFNTYDDQGEIKKYNFDNYLDGDLPEDCGCVYIFAKTFPDNSKSPGYNHIGYIERLSMIFDKENIKSKLGKYHSNSILIYKCDNENEMINIVEWIKKSHKIDD
jgi:hypothetical protein